MTYLTMLKALRKNTKLIIWGVVICFALWGGFSVGTSFKKEGRLAGEVFGKGVSFQEFDLFHRSSQIFSFSGKPIDDPETLKQHAWQSVIFSREGQRQKIQVTDDEVRAEIKRLLAAQKIEDPTPEAYQRWLADTLRETPQQFESQIREILRIQKLIRQVDAEPVEPPTDEEALKKFLVDSQTLSAEAAKFPALEQAEGFYEKVKGGKKWREETKKIPELVAAGSPKSLADFAEEWQLPEPEVFRLYALSKGEVLEPVPSRGQFVVFRLFEKKPADEKKFQGVVKEQYLQSLTNQKKQQRFLLWSIGLLDKAGLKDYLPRSEAAGAGPSSDSAGAGAQA